VKAVRWHGRGDLRVDEIEMPLPADDEVLIRVEWCGICGTDLEEYRSGPLMIPVDAPHPLRGGRAPLTMGHEMVGWVVQAAADGSGPGAGTVVIPDVVVGCGACWWCLRHEEGLCPQLSVRGQTEDGGLAQFMVARAATCLVVPDSVPADHAALVEPASVAVRALRKLGTVIGARVAVIGAGTVGQLVARVASAFGATVELVVDPSEVRRDRALQHGAARAAHPSDALTVAAASDRGGYDVAIECSGARGTLQLAVDLVRRGGTVVALGIRPSAEPLDSTALVLAEKRIIGSAAHLWDDDSSVALDLIASGALQVGDLISHRVTLDETATSGFSALASGDPHALKVLVDCA
jgi:(R,R)-butanediol dehydrogenase / meso-butanediol dehydrogenase / diacetyl reductase